MGRRNPRKIQSRKQTDLSFYWLAACHWCHVMAHESFEDPEVAAFMNEHYVDREERPDLDAIYTALGHKLRFFENMESAICDRGYYICKPRSP
jgi:Protein of unknown function, DUF255